MNEEKLREDVMKILWKAEHLLYRKGHDYGDEDRLRNFKHVSKMWSILTGKEMTPTEAALFLLLLKIDRYMNLYKKGEEALNESVEDTVVDGINYWLLMEANRKDE